MTERHRATAQMRTDRGSTVPVILGFFLVALLTVAGAVAAGQAFVQQRDLQDLCDGAATAAAGTAIDLSRTGGVVRGGELRFTGVRAEVQRYLARQGQVRTVSVGVAVSIGRTELALTCVQTRSIAFGALFGRPDGVRHVVHATARAPVLG
jgi:cytochrome c biogenesis protein CcdA